MGYLIYRSYLICIFAKMALLDLSCISLFYFDALTLWSWTASDTEWRGLSDLNQYNN